MADQSIRRHLLSLEQHGELIRFDREVDPDENLSAVSWKTFAELGKAGAVPIRWLRNRSHTHLYVSAVQLDGRQGCRRAGKLMFSDSFTS